MSGTPTSLSSAVAVLGLAGGFLAARQTGRRELGGALFAAAGAWVRARVAPRIRTGGCRQPERRVRGRDGRLAPPGEAHRRVAVGRRGHGRHCGRC
jgi:hypothetical protein